MDKQEAIEAKEKLIAKIERFNNFSAAAALELISIQSIIDATPEPKIGRIMSVDEVPHEGYIFESGHTLSRSLSRYTRDTLQRWISVGVIFHDAETCDKYGEYLKLEQELRLAQIEDGGDEEGFEEYVCVCNKFGDIITLTSGYVEKVAFRTASARLAFFDEHTDAQIKLLIEGV